METWQIPPPYSGTVLLCLITNSGKYPCLGPISPIALTKENSSPGAIIIPFIFAAPIFILCVLFFGEPAKLEVPLPKSAFNPKALMLSEVIAGGFLITINLMVFLSSVFLLFEFVESFSTSSVDWRVSLEE